MRKKKIEFTFKMNKFESNPRFENSSLYTIVWF
jgi:hypothetical protein